MTVDKYKESKKRSRITVSDIWTRAIRVTPDQDKSFSSGRTLIPDEVAKRVDELLRSLEVGASELELVLREQLPDCGVSLDPDSLDISIAFPQGKIAVLTMRGVDFLTHSQMYDVDRNGAGAATFIRMTPEKWEDKETSGFRWYLWRGDFVHDLYQGILQNYRNRITRRLMFEALKRYTQFA